MITQGTRLVGGIYNTQYHQLQVLVSHKTSSQIAADLGFDSQ